MLMWLEHGYDRARQRERESEHILLVGMCGYACRVT